MFAWGAGTALGRWSYALFYAHMASGLFLGFFVGRRGWVRRLDALAPRLPRVQAAALAIAAGLFVTVQLPFSAWWLAHHAHGPFEAVWRRLSYGRSVD